MASLLSSVRVGLRAGCRSMSTATTAQPASWTRKKQPSIHSLECLDRLLLQGRIIVLIQSLLHVFRQLIKNRSHRKEEGHDRHVGRMGRQDTRHRVAGKEKMPSWANSAARDTINGSMEIFLQAWKEASAS